jgi:O-antigen biosynthesis protein
MIRKAKTAYNVIKSDGMIGFSIKVLQKLNTRIQKQPHGNKQKIQMLVKYEDAQAADWSRLPGHIKNPASVNKKSYNTAWIMSPPGESSGGHQNIFRFIEYLEKGGHKAKIYIYSSSPRPVDIGPLKKMLKENPSYPDLDAEIEIYKKNGVDDDTDAVFATGWETAYPAFNDKSKARRFYFVQDFEPYFYPVGSESLLAENTYKFGFYGITAGGWLAAKLAKDYGMKTDHFDFGAEKSIYNFTNHNVRKEIFFYARPVTPRRGFEVGIMALDLFAKARPDYNITLAGWDVSNYDIPFKYNNLSNLKITELNKVYNNCAAALVLSLTNMSLLPLELLSSGVIPVVNDGINNTLVSDNKFIEYCEMSPRALADKLIEVVDKKDLPSYAKQASESVESLGWDKSGEKFVSILERAMKNG